MSNTRVDYLYRDANNYKLHGRAIFIGAITDTGRKVLEEHGEGWGFAPENVGLLELSADEGWILGEDDPVTQEFSDIRVTEELATDLRTIHAFIDGVVE